jgi:hypothetical protein
MLDETMDDPLSTQLPLTWRGNIEDPDTIAAFFGILRREFPMEETILACQCLVELANCRMSLFKSKDSR